MGIRLTLRVDPRMTYGLEFSGDKFRQVHRIDDNLLFGTTPTTTRPRLNTTLLVLHDHRLSPSLVMSCQKVQHERSRFATKGNVCIRLTRSLAFCSRCSFSQTRGRERRSARGLRKNQLGAGRNTPLEHCRHGALCRGDRGRQLLL